MIKFIQFYSLSSLILVLMIGFMHTFLDLNHFSRHQTRASICCDCKWTQLKLFTTTINCKFNLSVIYATNILVSLFQHNFAHQLILWIKNSITSNPWPNILIKLATYFILCVNLWIFRIKAVLWKSMSF